MVQKDFDVSDAADADEMVHRIASDWKQAGLSPENQALCEFASKLTVAPTQMSEQDIIQLRNLGFCDQSIHDATQVISYFNYINRIADSLNIDLEDGVHAWESSIPEQSK